MEFGILRLNTFLENENRRDPWMNYSASLPMAEIRRTACTPILLCLALPLQLFPLVDPELSGFGQKHKRQNQPARKPQPDSTSAGNSKK
jgi:hypothetical protein